jgi:hypothetical protein
MQQTKTQPVVIFANFHEKFMNEVSEAVGLKYGARVLHCCFWNGESPREQDLFCDYYDLSRFRSSKSFSLAAEVAVFDPLILEQFQPYYGEFRHLVERYSLKRFDEELSLSFFHLLIGYWSRKLRDFSISNTSVFFDSTPHQPWDYTLYLVAQNLGMKVLIIKRTKLPKYLLLSSSLRNEDFINVDSQDLQTTINQMKTQVYWNQYTEVLDNQLKESARSAYRIIKLFKKILLQFTTSYYKNHYFELSRLNYLSAVFKLIRTQLQSQAFLWKYWGVASFKKELNWLTKVGSQDIYVALHYQPERTTIPEAGFLADQLTAIRMLSKVISKESRIYVKEHPQQLLVYDLNLRKTSYRSPRYYSALTSIPNVVVVPKKIRASEIIKRVGIVSSATGSVLWEALHIGKPVLTFAPTWLSGNQSVIDLSSLSLTNSQLQDLFEQTSEEVKSNTFLHLSDLAPYLVPAPHSDSQASPGPEERNREIDALASAFVRALNRIGRI